MQRRLLLATALFLGFGTAGALGQSPTAPKPMAVSTGSTSGTYYRLIKEFNDVVPALVLNTESDGSLTNIDRVMGNRAELGITQFDALHLRAIREPNLRDRLRVLMPLYLEELHFITKSAARSEGGLSAFGFRTNINAKAVHLSSVDDLRGRKVGFWGGAIITEHIIAQVTLIGWAPVEFADQKMALEALKADKIDAIIAVGGQPLGWVSELPRDYKLLTVSDAMMARLAPIYDKAVVTYRNLGQDGVQTVAVQAMLVTRNYASKGKRDQLQMLHVKLAKAIIDLREIRGTHPKWEDIDPAATTDKWPMFLPVR